MMAKDRKCCTYRVSEIDLQIVSNGQILQLPERNKYGIRHQKYLGIYA